MELASKYNPADVEGKWYQYWLDHKLFSSKPDGREPYTVVIPPPNVTGVLHMGHMLNNTIQDILVRRARMEGKNACWVPGTDHASICSFLVCIISLLISFCSAKVHNNPTTFINFALNYAIIN